MIARPFFPNQWIVGTFLKLPADIAVVTNIDPEHLDHFKTFDAIKDAFLALIGNLPFYGFAVMSTIIRPFKNSSAKSKTAILTYGENPQADVRLMDVNLAGGVTRFSGADPSIGDGSRHLH